MRYLLRLLLPRLVLTLVTLVAVSALIFWATEILPGDTATRVLGRDATPESLQALREQLNLDESALARYGEWLGDFVRGDWGNSLVADRAVTDVVLPRLENSLMLAALALAMYVPLSLLLGMITAVYRERRFSAWLSALVVAGTALPEFVVGLFLILAFAVWQPWFPPLSLVNDADSLAELLQFLFLPAVTLTIAMTAYAVRMMQASLVNVLESDYVRMATLKGVSRRRVLLRHALPNALGPALRVTVLNIAFVIGGIVTVEIVFTFPGIGALFVNSIRLLDTPVILAIAMILSTVYIVANLGADIVAAALNPRLRTGAH